MVKKNSQLIKLFVMMNLLLGLAVVPALAQSDTSEATEEPLEPLLLDATYVDHYAGYAFNYPSDWDLSPAQFASGGIGHTTILISPIAETEAKGEGVPADVVKIDFSPTFQFGDYANVEEMAAADAEGPEGPSDILFEEGWTLFGHYPAIRRHIDGMAGEVAIMYFMFGERGMMMVNYGDLSRFEEIAATLRPAIAASTVSAIDEISTYTDTQMGYTFDYPSDWLLVPADYSTSGIGQVNRLERYDESGTILEWIEFSPIWQFNDFQNLDQYIDFQQGGPEGETTINELWRAEVALYEGLPAVRIQNSTMIAGEQQVLYTMIAGRTFMIVGYNLPQDFDAIAASIRPAEITN